MCLILSCPRQWVSTGCRDVPPLIPAWWLTLREDTGQTRRKKAYQAPANSSPTRGGDSLGRLGFQTMLK